MKDFSSYLSQGYDAIASYAPRVVLAILVLIIGIWIINKLVKATANALDKGSVDPSLKGFLSSITKIALKVLLLISVAGMLGVKTTSFIAIIGAAGLAIGLALQGTLANFAGGVLILIFKPYKVGDLIEAQGHRGIVKEIQMFVTIILTAENKTVFIPNGAMSNGNIVNFTLQNLIRVDMKFGISYKSDITKTKEVLMNLMTNHPKVLKDPVPFVGVVELANSSVNLVARPYTRPEDYWEVYFYMYENAKIELENAGISIPFPQVDVHLNQ